MKLVPEKPKENDEQKAAVAYVKMRGYGDYLVMIPNGIQLPGGATTRAKYMNHLKAMGLHPGAADLFFALPRVEYHGAWFEMKRRYTGVVAKAQDKFIATMMDVGYFVRVCHGFDNFRKHFDEYLALR